LWTTRTSAVARSRTWSHASSGWRGTLACRRIVWRSPAGGTGGSMGPRAGGLVPPGVPRPRGSFGVTRPKGRVEGFPAYWESFLPFIYAKFGDPRDPKDVAYMHDRSPLYFVDRIQKPLLVVQGDKDVRVKKDQSDRIVDALKARNVPVHYLVLTN